MAATHSADHWWVLGRPIPLDRARHGSGRPARGVITVAAFTTDSLIAELAEPASDRAAYLASATGTDRCPHTTCWRGA